MASRKDSAHDAALNYREYKTARGRLAAFLTALDPLSRRLITGEGFDEWDHFDFFVLDDPAKREFLEAEQTFFKLLAEVCREGPSADLLTAVCAEWSEITRRSHGVRRKRGAHPKPWPLSMDVVNFRAAELMATRLTPGMELKRAIKEEKGFRSDDSQIEPRLQALDEKYNQKEIVAILKCQTPKIAAAHVLTGGRTTLMRTFLSSVARGRTIQRRAGRSHLQH